MIRKALATRGSNAANNNRRWLWVPAFAGTTSCEPSRPIHMRLIIEIVVAPAQKSVCRFQSCMNDCSLKTSARPQEQAFGSTVFSWAATREDGNMRKLSLALATLATIAVAAPTIASAEDF